MGDLPSRRTRTGNELTDQIFEGPLKHVSFKQSKFYVCFFQKKGIILTKISKNSVKIWLEFVKRHGWFAIVPNANKEWTHRSNLWRTFEIRICFFQIFVFFYTNLGLSFGENKKILWKLVKNSWKYTNRKWTHRSNLWRTSETRQF